jgi:hypothetical protein
MLPDPRQVNELLLVVNPSCSSAGWINGLDVVARANPAPGRSCPAREALPYAAGR